MPQEKIIIKFKPSGDKELINAINTLNAATKKLTGSTVAVAKATKGSTAATTQATVATSLLGTGTKRLAKNNSMLANSFATLRSKLLLISFGAMIVERAFVSLVKTYGRQEAANDKLRVGLANVANTTEGVTQRLVDYSSALQKVTAFGDEMITTGMVQFTTFGLNEQAIKSLTPQVLNVARAIQTASGAMPDLNSLFIAFGKATTTGIGTLTRYGVVLTEAEREQLKLMDANESAVEIAKILERQYGGLADAYAKTTAGMLEAAAAARGDAAEALGEVLAPAVLAVSKGLKVMFEAMSPTRIKQYGSGLGIAAIATTGLAVATGRLNLQLALTSKAMTRTGIGALVVIAGLAVGKILDLFGAFEDGEDTIIDSEKSFNKLNEALKNTIELQEKYSVIMKKFNEEMDDLNKETLDGLIGAMKALADEMRKQDEKALTEEIRKLNEEKKKLEQQIKDEIRLQAELDEIDRKLLVTLKAIAVADKELTLANQEKNALFDNQITIQEKLMANDEKWMQVQEKLTVAQNEFDVAGQAAAQRELNAVKKESISLRLQELDQETQGMILKENRAVLDGRQTELQAEQNIIDTQRNQLEQQYFDILHSDDPDTRLAFKQAQLELDQQQLDLTNKIFQTEQAVMVARIQMWSKGIAAIGNILGANSRNAKLAANIQVLASVVDAFAAAQSSFAAAATHPLTVLNPAYPGIVYATTLASGLAQAASAKAAADKMEQGGLIGGRRHSQGGTMINAEAGEFVMSRDAVDSVGIENLNRMNQGGGGAITVNVSGNLLSSEYVEGELAEAIKEASRRGTDFGLS